MSDENVKDFQAEVGRDLRGSKLHTALGKVLFGEQSEGVTWSSMIGILEVLKIEVMQHSGVIPDDDSGG